MQHAAYEVGKFTDVSSSDEEDKEVPTYQITDQNGLAALRSELRLMARYLLQFKAKYGNRVTLFDTFEKQYINYTSKAIRKCTWHFQHLVKCRKLIHYISECLNLLDHMRVSV